MPPEDFPLTTMVLNVTNQCNLSCTYCYEYGEDKIVDTENGKKPKFMSEATARESVDFMLRQAGANRAVHLTFFGGETLLNFPVLKSTVAYARQQARSELGKEVDFSLTTNATLLRPEIIEWLVENQRRRHDLDRRPEGDAGPVPRLQERRGQLRHRRAEDQGAAAAASQPADRGASHADVADARRARASTGTSRRRSDSGKSASRR